MKTEIAPSTKVNMPPEDLIAEEAIVGGVLKDPEAIYRIETPLVAEDFYHTAHQKIYEAFLYWHERGAHPDQVTVTGWLRDNGHMEIVGEDRLASLYERVISAANINAYAVMVAKKSKLRSLIACGAKLQHLGHQPDRDIDELINEAEASVLEISGTSAAIKSRSMAELGRDYLKALSERMGSPGLPGIKSGLDHLDALTQGFRRKNLIIVAARPAMGKTAASVGFARSIAEDTGQRVVFFSLEMSEDELYGRMISGEARISSNRLGQGVVAPTELPALTAAAERISQLNLDIKEKSEIPLNEVRSVSRKAAAQHGQLGAIIIDYLQIMGGADENRVQSLGIITRGLKALAKELDTPVILLSQLTRGPDSRTNKRPVLSDLRDSGSIEQDADSVLMLYRDEYYNPDTVDRGIVEIIAVKNRHGKTGTAKALFQPEFTLFLNMEGS